VDQGIPTPAYAPYENRSTAGQVSGQQIKPSFFLFTNKPNVMHFSFIHPFKLHLRGEHAPVTELVLHQLSHDKSEGSEFLDDALRMEDLSFTPLNNRQENMAAGRPENLL
jgi:hypothetical protein